MFAEHTSWGITVCVSMSASAQSFSRKSHKLAYLQIKDIEFHHYYLQTFLSEVLLRCHRISIATMLSIFPTRRVNFPIKDGVISLILESGFER